jgi:hypothetical protein
MRMAGVSSSVAARMIVLQANYTTSRLALEMKGRRGGPRLGAGRKHTVQGEPRRNRVVALLTDAEHAKLERLAARDQVPLGTKAWEILARVLRRAK